MIRFFAAISCIVVVLARPDGYNYEQPPPASTGTCCQQLALLRAAANNGGAGANNLIGSSSQSTGRIVNGNNQHGLGGSQSINLASSRGGFSSSNNGFIGGTNGGAAFNPANNGNGHLQGSSSNSNFNSIQGSNSNSNFNSIQGSSSGNNFNSISFGGGSAQIQKHIYVHVPPNDPEEASTLAKYSALLQPKKHYKIIFIKAPNSPNLPSAQLIANMGNSEEKTLVYVLSKKPDEPTFAEVQAAMNTHQPSKPEVYFIKYKARHETPNTYETSFGGSDYNGASSSHSSSSYSISNSDSYPYPGKSAITDVTITTESPNTYIPPPPSPSYGAP